MGALTTAFPKLHLFTFVIYALMTFYVFARNADSALNRITAALLGCFAVWSLKMVFVHNPHSSEQVARLANNLGTVGSYGFSSFILWFALIYTERKRFLARWYGSFLLVLPAVVFVIAQWADLMSARYEKTYFGWAAVWSKSPFVYLFFLYYISFTIGAMWLILDNAQHQGEPKKRAQAIVIAVTMGVSLILGTLTDVVLPEINVLALPDIADIIAIIWASGLVYAMVRYNFMTISPRYAAETIVSTMAEAMVLLDPGGRIVDANPATKCLLGYDKTELQDQPVAMLFGDPGLNGFLFSKVRQDGAVKAAEWTLRTKDKRDITVLFSASLVRGKSNEPTGIVCVASDITERIAAEERVRQSLKEKEILLREIHHRVKNNMQIISSLLKLEADYQKNDQLKHAFQDSQHRIRVMALVHEKLYRSESLAGIDFEEYVKSLVRELFRSYNANPDRISLSIEMGSVKLGLDHAIPCGLIINELVSNSLKYAFPGGRRGHIGVTLESIAGGIAELCVFDDGIGIPSQVDLENSPTLGLRLVAILARDQLKGEFVADRSKGISITVRFRT